ncbi:MAG: hypothetical protein NT129_04475 [Candidatus Aenigmarchaeota archaeon]|nr:hypothetical protein [Candidatus Aenigmarchaeota archaeon]
MKGQQQALSAILITAVLIGVVGSVYFWGLPLIQKSKDISVLGGCESFMMNLNNKIKDTANHGGSDSIEITVPGTLKFDGANLTLYVDTAGIIYDVNALIPLSRNDCSSPEGTWGIDNPEVLCIWTECLGSGKCEKYHTEYKLHYLTLNVAVESSMKAYKIELIGNQDYGGEHRYVKMENKGTTEEMVDGRTLISTKIGISII